MGQDAKLYLPLDIKDMDIAMALGALMGAERKMEPLESGGGVMHYDVKSTDLVPEKAYQWHTVERDSLDLPMVRLGHNINHLTGGWRINGSIGMYFSGDSSAPTIALFRRLAKLFGGTVVPNDCEEGTHEEYERPAATKDEEGLYPNDGEAWERLQQHLYDNTTPVTDEELIGADSAAGYKLEAGKTTGSAWADAVMGIEPPLTPAQKAWKTRKAKQA
jgi:hypothetical protein